MHDVICVVPFELVKGAGDLRSGRHPAAAVIAGGAMVEHEVQVPVPERERYLVGSNHRAGERQQALGVGCPDENEEG